MLLGLLVIAVPLLVAVLSAALQIRTLADTSRKLVVEGVTAARTSQDLAAQIGSLERTTKLYQVLGTGNMLEVYREQDTRLTATRERLSKSLLSKASAEALRELADEQKAISAVVLSMPPKSEIPSNILDKFNILENLSDKLSEQGRDEIDAQVAALEKQTEKTQHRLYLQSALLLPLSVCAIVILTLVVGRPLRVIDRAVSELGRGNFSHAISVRGPLDLQRLGRQLEWLRVRLLDLAQERNRFLRHMSHELKTPLANIREGTELLMDGAVGQLDGNQREVMAILRDNGIKLQRLIENLLSFSAWQTNSVGLETSEFRVRPVVKQVLENQQLTLLSQRVRLDVHVEDVTLRGDRGKLRLILENLVSNAIKYSPKGGTIHLSARREGEQFVLDVADSGPGVPLEDRPHIFDAFYTSKTPKSSSIKGTGIGLSVVLEFVSAHGGSIELIDGEFPGAHFRITMPLARARDSEPAKIKERAHAA